MTAPVITEQAQADLDEAWDYLSVRDLRAADRWIDRFVSAARIHARFPESGRDRQGYFEVGCVAKTHLFRLPPRMVCLRDAPYRAVSPLQGEVIEFSDRGSVPGVSPRAVMSHPFGVKNRDTPHGRFLEYKVGK